jgi:molybdenum cofactor biosynthesis enzyme
MIAQKSNSYQKQKETEALIRFNETSKGKTIQEAQMILNHKKTLEPINFISCS